MKLLGALVAVATLAAAVWSPRPKDDPWIFIIGGDTQGYLSPCGCVKPMAGGIERRFSLTKTLTKDAKTVVLENGGLIDDLDRQGELKAEALAETLKESGVDAINLAPKDLRLGEGMISSVQRLSGNKVVSTSPTNFTTFGIPSSIKKGPFLIGALNGENPTRDEFALAGLIEDAKLDSSHVILLLAGDASRAGELAQEFPQVKLIVYRRPGNPPQEPVRIGETLIVTPGEKGRHLLRLVWNGVTFESYEVFALGPEVPDDPKTAKLYHRYLDRVKNEKLLEQVPRTEHIPYAGNQACQSCHQDAFKIWKDSEHSHALTTLEETNHDGDPECVGCHVVGLNSTKGFKSAAKTPDLQHVGCESCHGSGVLHVMEPDKNRMPKVGEKSCEPCHNLEHSPTFDFLTYWEKIKH